MTARDTRPVQRTIRRRHGLSYAGTQSRSPRHWAIRAWSAVRARLERVP
jgi:hypothetical protein